MLECNANSVRCQHLENETLLLITATCVVRVSGASSPTEISVVLLCRTFSQETQHLIGVLGVCPNVSKFVKRLGPELVFDFLASLIIHMFFKRK